MSEIEMQQTHTHRNVQMLPTHLMVMHSERGIPAFTHNGRHSDLPNGKFAVMLFFLLLLLDVQCCIFAWR